MNGEVFCFDAVAPVRERGLKSLPLLLPAHAPACRSRKGAWIEICAYVARYVTKKVAPVRERGLK